MDYKSQLQEVIQQQNNGMLSYEIVEEKGPAHNRTFVSRVMLNTRELGIGKGRSKKEAEQHAARLAILALKDHEREE
jgi:ribonuclease-3